MKLYWAIVNKQLADFAINRQFGSISYGITRMPCNLAWINECISFFITHLLTASFGRRAARGYTRSGNLRKHVLIVPLKKGPPSPAEYNQCCRSTFYYTIPKLVTLSCQTSTSYTLNDLRLQHLIEVIFFCRTIMLILLLRVDRQFLFFATLELVFICVPKALISP